MRKDYKPGGYDRDHIDRTIAQVFANWRKEQEEKQRSIAAMLAAGQRQPKEGEK